MIVRHDIDKGMWVSYDDHRAEMARVEAERDKALADFNALADHHASNECSSLGSAFCLAKDPLHFHHDGCPYEAHLVGELDGLLDLIRNLKAAKDRWDEVAKSEDGMDADEWAKWAHAADLAANHALAALFAKLPSADGAKETT